MRVFFATRRLCQRLQGQEEKELPLTDPNNSASEGDIVDLSECVCVCGCVGVGVCIGVHACMCVCMRGWACLLCLL